MEHEELYDSISAMSKRITILEKQMQELVEIVTNITSIMKDEA